MVIISVIATATLLSMSPNRFFKSPMLAGDHICIYDNQTINDGAKKTATDLEDSAADLIISKHRLQMKSRAGKGYKDSVELPYDFLYVES